MARRIPYASHRGERVQLDEATLGQLPAKQEAMDAETGAGAEGLRLQRQTGAHGSLRKGPEGRAVGQSIAPHSEPVRNIPRNMSVNQYEFLRNPLSVTHRTAQRPYVIHFVRI